MGKKRATEKADKFGNRKKAARKPVLGFAKGKPISFSKEDRAQISDEANALQPSMALLARIGSALVHAAEYHSAHGTDVDLQQFGEDFNSEDVQRWIKAMKSLLPLPRGPLVIVR